MSTTGSAESYIELRGSLSIPDAITGKSAYEIAVANGFEGTEAEWLESLTEQTKINAEKVIEEANNAIELLEKEKQEAINEATEGKAEIEAARVNGVNDVVAAKTEGVNAVAAAKKEAVDHIASLAEGAYDIVQATGDSENKVMSQKSVTDLIFDKLTPDNITDGYIDNVEDVVSVSGWSTVYFTVTPNTRYRYLGLTTVGNAPMSGFYDSKANRIELFKQAVDINDVITPEGAVSLRFSVKNTDLATFNVSRAIFADAVCFAEIEEEISQKADINELFEKIEPSNTKNGYYLDKEIGDYGYTGWNIVEFLVEPYTKYIYSGLTTLGGAPYSGFFSGNEPVEFFKQATGENIIMAPPEVDTLRVSVKDVDLANFTLIKAIYADASKTSEKISQCEKSIAQQEKKINLTTGDFASILEYGYIRTNDGTDAPWTARLRFSKIIKEPFSVYLNNGFHIFRIFYYNKETDEYIGYDDKYELLSTEYISNGEYGVRLVIYKHATEDEEIPETEIPFIFKNVSVGNSEKLAQNVCNYTSLKDLPDPTASVVGVIPDKSAGMIWSDKSVWRWAKNNELAVSARRYKTIKVSDGSTINEKDPDTVEVVHSISKVLGALMAVRYVSNLNETATIAQSDIINTSDKIVKAGDVLTYSAILHSALIQSDNNAAESLSRLIGYRINPSANTDEEARASYSTQAEAVARELEMTNTTDFRSPAWSLKSTATDLCKLYKHIVENEQSIMDIWGKLTYEMSVTGTNARTWTINSTTSDQDRAKVPEFVGGKTGSGDVEGCWGFVWRNPNDNELYITIQLGYDLAKGNKAVDGRQIIDEVYSLS